MRLADEQLAAIAGQIKKGVAPSRVPVRSLLLWFGAERRGYRIVREIRAALKKHCLATEPDFEFAYIDSLMTFKRGPEGGDPLAVAALPDATYRVGRLEAANKPPMTVKPDAPLKEVFTMMLANDFSQVPVMPTARELKGIVSWKGIGSRLALKRPCDFARDCLDQAQEVSIDHSLFEIIPIIAMNGYVLVRGSDKTICGIITASDVNEQFRTLAEPFLLVGEIERGLRHMLHGKFSAAELNSAKAPNDEGESVEGVSDLTLGEMERLIEEEKHWKKLGVEVDRVHFVSQLRSVREIRNDVMHFDPDGLEVKTSTCTRPTVILRFRPTPPYLNLGQIGV